MKYFNLFSTIHITKGFNRILINDLQRNESELYPVEFLDIIEELNKQSIEELENCFDEESKPIFQEYFNILMEKEYGFITNDNWDRNFPALSTEFNNYSAITNMIVELGEISVLEKIKNSIDNLDIHHLVIFSERNLELQDFEHIESLYFTSTLESIEVYFPFQENIDEAFFESLHKKAVRISNVIVYNCSKKIKLKQDYRFTVSFTDKKLSKSSCGVVDLKYFSTNITKITESINHNSCLHKKIAIDKDGNFKNCPAMQQSFGNIEGKTLEEALNHQDFKKYWNVTKDLISVCKDCEFRNVCTDCRAFTEQNTFENDIDLSKPLKCGYNPYTSEWKEWSTNPLKKKQLDFVS